LIAQATIDAIVDRVESGEIDEQHIGALRCDFPDLHFTWCMDDDIGAETPFAEHDGFKLYLVDGQGHCLKLTTDPAIANGVVIAEVID